MSAPRVRLVVSDVDGTLVTSGKVLSDATVAAVASLRAAGIEFAVTSGRPPRGMSMLIEPLGITQPLGGFNGGLVVDPQLRALREHRVPAQLVGPVLSLLERHGLGAWVFQGNDWLVLDADGPHVAHEAATCQFDALEVKSFEGRTEHVLKIVGVSDDPERVARATAAAREEHGSQLSASSSQPYYLDVTHPDANKGTMVDYLAGRLGVPLSQVACIGDMANDVLMFAKAGVAIAMGNADTEVQRSAWHVTRTNDDDGFAHAMASFVLPG